MAAKNKNILFLGDSNIAGKASAPYTIAHNDVYVRTPVANWKYAWVHIEYPMYIDPRFENGSAHAAIGNYLQPDFGSIGFCGGAYGGSNTAQWQRGETYYEWWTSFVQWLKVDASIDSFDVLWMGFHDYAADTWNDPEGYYLGLKAIIDNVRTDVGQPNLPVINTFMHNVNSGEILPDSIKTAIDVNYQLALLDNVYSFVHGIVQKKRHHNDHYTMVGLEELGEDLGWHLKGIFNGTPIESGRFVGVEYVGGNVFRAEIDNPNNYALFPQRPSDIRWYDDNGEEIKSKNTLVDNNYVYSYLDMGEVSLPNTIMFRHQHGDYPEACQPLYFVSDVNIPVDKTGLNFETNNKIELSTLALEKQSSETESVKTKIKRGFV